jgi:hypothetical protein
VVRLPTLYSIGPVTAPTPYLQLPGIARDALIYYGEVSGCGVQPHTFDEFNRTDGPGDSIAHLEGGPIELFAADVAGDEPPFRSEGIMLSLLGMADPYLARVVLQSLRRWPGCGCLADATVGRIRRAGRRPIRPPLADRTRRRR